jgi:hypothetical protein
MSKTVKSQSFFFSNFYSFGQSKMQKKKKKIKKKSYRYIFIQMFNTYQSQLNALFCHVSILISFINLI